MEWTLLCALHYHELKDKKNAERLSKYKDWFGTLNFDGVEVPVKTCGRDFAKIEKMNNVSLNVFALRDEDCTKETFKKNLFLLYKSKTNDKPIFIFFYKEHYMFIHDWKAFTNEDGQHNFFCPNCMTCKFSQNDLDEHTKQCNVLDPMNTSMPKNGATVKFNSYHKTVKHPICVSCDFEAFNTPTTQEAKTEGKYVKVDRSGEEKLIDGLQKGVCSEQTAASCGFFVECDIPLSISQFHSVVKQSENDNIFKMITDKIREIETVVRKELFDDVKPQPILNEHERELFINSTHCPHCKWKYGSMRWSKQDEEFVEVDKVEDHDHRTGKFRSDLCGQCNLNLGKLEKKQARFINFNFHNLKGYDMHHIIQALAQDDTEGERMRCVPSNSEKYTTFSWKPLPCSKTEYKTLMEEFYELKNKLERKDLSQEEKHQMKERKAEIQSYVDSPLDIRFIDTMAFLASSLDTLLGNLPDELKTRLKSMAIDSKGNFDPDKFEMVKRKGDFPYEWFDDCSKLTATSLPTFNNWTSRLKRKFLESENELYKLQETWNYFGFKTFKDWHDHYLEIDVRGLAD
eukprot:4814317-Prymnesium_polylepis.1